MAAIHGLTGLSKRAIRPGTFSRAVSVLAFMFVFGCGGGGDDGGKPAPDANAPTRVGAGYVTIESPTKESTYSTQASSVSIGGSAFISPDTFVCCSGSATDTGVSVSWSSSTSAGGATSQSVQLCSFFGFGLFLCNHTWSATIPLVVGANVIRVSATDFGKNSGTDTITITRTPDTTPPNVSSVNPIAASVGVAVNGTVSVIFSELMDNSSITTATFLLRDGSGNAVPGSIVIVDRTATFQPSGFLNGFTVYTAILTTAIKDAAGNPLPSPFVWNFTTGTADLIRPVVSSLSPPTASTSCVPVDGDIVVTFSEAVNPTTVSNLGVSPSFTLVDTTDGPAHSFTVSGAVRIENGTYAVFDPQSSLAPSRTYTATLTTRITDLAGNHLLSNTSWSFSPQPANGGVGAWQTATGIGAPPVLPGQSVIWTGTEMIVFGGQSAAAVGARYSPASDTWTPLPGGGPSPRFDHVAIWTGTEMIIWGGAADSGAPAGLNEGSRYNPVTNTWTAMSTLSAPSSRFQATAVWTGTEMIVWGGAASLGNSTLRADHAAYNPSTDTWRAISSVGAPDPNMRVHHTAIWTGSKMIVWGGDVENQNCPACDSRSGGIYDPVRDTWLPVATTGAPPPRSDHSATWTGTEMAVWGGSDFHWWYQIGLSTGAFYNPATNTWRPLSTACAPAGRYAHSAVWTGSEIILWGGLSLAGSTPTSRASGARYDPNTNSWQQTTLANAPASGQRAVWTGSRMIIWGIPAGSLYTP